MITLKFNDKLFTEVKVEDFTFEQFEIATELLSKLQQISIESLGETSAEKSGVLMFDLLSKQKLERPLLALLFIEKGTEFTVESYNENIELFKKIKVKEFEKAREVVTNFFSSGMQYILRNSLISLQQTAV